MVWVQPALRRFIVVHMLTAGSFQAFQGLWAGPYAQSMLGLSATGVGNFLLVMSIGNILGFFLTGVAMDWLGRRTPVIVAGTMVYALLWAAQAASLAGWLPQAAFAVVGGLAATRGSAVAGFGLIASRVPAAAEGLDTAIVNTSPFLGGALFHVAIGYLMRVSGSVATDYTQQGFLLSFSLIAACAFVALALSTRIRE
jgi:MFS family permease